MLGRKQTVTNTDFVEAMRRAPAIISRDHLVRLVDRTVDDIRCHTAGKRAAYAWSGGKDSQALRALAERAGITDCVLVVCELEYPAFLRWVDDHRPPGLTVRNTGQDLAWLARCPHMLFPRDSRLAARWYRVVQHAGQERYCREHDIDMLLTGRRVLDGNYVGGQDGVYTARGVTRYSPLRAWTHEEVFALLHHQRLPLPPCYQWPNGYLEGTHPWPCRTRCASIATGWREVHTIDASIVRGAAPHLPSAEVFLRGLSI